MANAYFILPTAGFEDCRRSRSAGLGTPSYLKWLRIADQFVSARTQDPDTKSTLGSRISKGFLFELNYFCWVSQPLFKCLPYLLQAQTSQISRRCIWVLMSQNSLDMGKTIALSVQNTGCEMPDGMKTEGLHLGFLVTHAPKKEQSAPSACTLALSYFELAAPSLGLGACWAGFFYAASNVWPPMQQALALPEGHASFGAMMVGYPEYAYHRLPLRSEPLITWR